MLIHPTFNFIPCSRPKSRHASPNYQRPPIMAHGLMDMLRSNAFSIFNPTPWPTILITPTYICIVIGNHTFPSINGPILIPSANLMLARACSWLRNCFFCCTCAPNLASLKAHLIILSNNNLPISNQIFFCCKCNSKSTFNNKSDTTPLLLVYKKLWTPTSLFLNLAPYIVLKIRYIRLVHAH